MPYLSLEGGKLYFEDHGSGDCLILMAGFGQDPSAWAEQLPIYSRHFRVLLLDIRAGGRSDVPGKPFTAKDLADDVIALMDHLKIERAHFGGFSLGGAAGLELAAKYPDRLISLSLHSTWAATETYPHFKQWIEIRQRIIAQNDPVVNLGTRFVSYFSPEFLNNRPEKINEYLEFAKANSVPITPRGIELQGEACITHDARPILQSINVPTLITVGTKDRTTLPAASEYLQQKIQQAELVLLQGAGHLTMFEVAPEFTSVSLGFLVKQNNR